MQNTKITPEIRIIDEITGMYLATLSYYPVETFEDGFTVPIRYIVYNGEKYPLSHSMSTPLPIVYMKWDKLQESEKSQCAIKAKQVLDLEHLRQLSTRTSVHCVGVDIEGRKILYKVRWEHDDILGYHNIWHVTEVMYGKEIYNKIVGYSALQERLPLLCESLLLGTVFQVNGEKDLFTLLSHPYARIEVQ